ncbi:helix-turn-helix domain-containing protein [Parvularcula marina]|uniref:helix-turn-helix domain-containing protein n=1 Tax=Parvularcula marina TaxID=2292771 RepID=UPI003518AC91
MSATQAIMAAPILTAGLALSFLGTSRQKLAAHPVLIYWALFVTGVFSFCLVAAAGEHLGPLLPIFTFACSATCGIAWLLTRSLFRPDGGRWPVVLVVVLYLTGFVLDLNADAPANIVTGVVSNIFTLISSTVLLLPLFEPLEGLRTTLPAEERTFRKRFVAGYALLFTAAVVLQREVAAFTVLDSMVIKVTCAVFAVAGASIAVRYRLFHPLPAGSSRQQSRRTPLEADHRLGARISQLLEAEQLFTNPEIKVADLSAALGEPDYKVSQAITGALGYPNFNRLINHHRIGQAKAMLGDEHHAGQSILSVAMECGFGSIGPFNRAFKEETGMTPGAYRTAARSGELQTA